MIAAVAIALALVLEQTPPPAAPPAPAPPAAPAPQGEAAPNTVSPVVVTAAAAPDPEQIAADLARMYDQSCGGRIYGTYADACNGLASQLAKAQAEARKSAARKAKLVKSAPPAAATH